MAQLAAGQGVETTPISDKVQVIRRDDLETIDMRRKMRAAEMKRRQIHKLFLKERKVPVSLAPAYRAHMGKMATISINALTIAVPVNGRTYEIPESFATELHRRRLAIDEIELKKEAMANIHDNFDGRSPGTLKLF